MKNGLGWGRLYDRVAVSYKSEHCLPKEQKVPGGCYMLQFPPGIVNHLVCFNKSLAAKNTLRLP